MNDPLFITIALRHYINMHLQYRIELGLGYCLIPYCVYASSKESGETSSMRRLA